MKTTVELPMELLRRAKAEAALQGRTLKDLLIEALREKLARRDRAAVTGWRAVAGKAPKGATRELESRMKDLERIDDETWR
jgi:hypothetical protein